jgi:hypothetical protein
MVLMEQTTALLRSKGVIIDAECDAMFQSYLSFLMTPQTLLDK